MNRFSHPPLKLTYLFFIFIATLSGNIRVQTSGSQNPMFIGFIFIIVITGVLAAGLGMILLDFSFFWAALTYTIVGSLGFLAAAGICILRTNDPLHSAHK